MEIQFNDPYFIEKFKSEISKVKADRKAINSNIKPWIKKIKASPTSKNEKTQKIKELIDVGDFLYYYGNGIKIKDILTESPDCIAEQDEKLIGIEIKDLIIQNKAKEVEGTLRSLFKEIESELNNEKYNGIYRIEFFEEAFSLKRKDRLLIKNEIIDFILNGKFNLKNSFIKKISKSPYNKIHLYRSEAIIVGGLIKRMILESIKAKEKNIDRYKNNITLDELWLLLVINGVQKSSDYSFVDKAIISDEFDSNFDKIFIYDFFRRSVIKLKIRNKTN